MSDKTVRLTVAQALVRFLAQQYSERDGEQQRLIPGCFGIFGHGNVAGVGQALLESQLTRPGEMPYYLARNKQAMVHAAVGFARMRNRTQAMACTASIGPGSTNMVTGAALATINRIPVLLLPSDVFATRVASLTAALGARHVIFVPVPGYRDDKTGEYLEPAELDADGWRTLCASADEIGRQIAEDFGVRLQFHPHADSHVMTQPQVERFLSGTDPRYVSLCLDPGHLAYGRADSVQIIRSFPDRIGYVHIKQMDPDIVAKAEAGDLPFGQAVAMGASVEPPAGLPDIPSVLAALNEAVRQELDAELFTVVEQDMYPCDFSKPKPIAKRTFLYLTAQGLGGSR